jgi:glycosyltransferase involved in cell wall biosynthesis
MGSKHTVLQILPRLETGGVERGTVEMVDALTTAGWRAIVASAGGQMVKDVERAGAKHIALPLASKNPLTILRNIDRLAKIIETYDVDLVHARSRAPAWSAYFAARRTETHFVTTFHSAYGARTIFKRLYNSVMAKGERVIAISQFVAQYAEELYNLTESKLRTIPRGVDIQQFDHEKIDPARIEKLRQEWDITDDKTIILLPGRLTRWKGQITFIKAIAELKRRNIVCLLVGPGGSDYRNELKQEIWLGGVDGIVHLVNECRDMPAAFALADIVVSASTRPEGFGRVIVEAQAMGCIVIATQHGGAKETIIPEKTGFLVPPSDVGALAETLEKVLAMPPAKRKKIGEQAIDHVRKNFSTTLMTQRTLSVYEEILKAS